MPSNILCKFQYFHFQFSWKPGHKRHSIFFISCFFSLHLVPLLLEFCEKVVGKCPEVFETRSIHEKSIVPSHFFGFFILSLSVEINILLWHMFGFLLPQFVKAKMQIHQELWIAINPGDKSKRNAPIRSCTTKRLFPIQYSNLSLSYAHTRNLRIHIYYSWIKFFAVTFSTHRIPFIIIFFIFFLSSSKKYTQFCQLLANLSHQNHCKTNCHQ